MKDPQITERKFISHINSLDASLEAGRDLYFDILHRILCTSSTSLEEGGKAFQKLRKWDKRLTRNLQETIGRMFKNWLLDENPFPPIRGMKDYTAKVAKFIRYWDQGNQILTIPRPSTIVKRIMEDEGALMKIADNRKYEEKLREIFGQEPLFSKMLGKVRKRRLLSLLSEITKINPRKDSDLKRIKVKNGKITELDLSNTDLEEIPDELDQYLQDLQKLKLRGTGITNLRVLREIDSLKELDLSETATSNLSSLKNLKELRKINLNGTNVSDLSPLSNLRNLRVLKLEGTGVSDLSPLKNLQNLRKVWLSGTNVSDLSPLTNSTHLQKLYLGGTEVSDISAVKELENLRDLDLNGTEISDISPLKVLEDLKKLRLQGTEVSDIKPLKELKKLQRLNLRGTNISDISPLEGLDLEELDLEGTNISNVSSLRNMPHLKKLNVRNTNISKENEIIESLKGEDVNIRL